MTRHWVLITGGAQRLGRELALAFADAGWGVACHYRSSGELAQALVAELRARGHSAVAVASALDQTNDARQLIQTTLDAIDGPLACVVNNASRFEPDSAEAFTEAGLLAQLQTNLIVPIELARLLHAQRSHASAPALPAGISASVVHVLDQKVFNLNPDYFSYTLSKLALERAVVQQAQSLAPLLRVNAIAPGLMYESGPQTPENFATARRANALRQPIDPAQVAQTAVFLAGNPCITGVSICVDNGQHLVPTERDIMFVTHDLLQGQKP